MGRGGPWHVGVGCEWTFALRTIRAVFSVLYSSSGLRLLQNEMTLRHASLINLNMARVGEDTGENQADRGAFYVNPGGG